MNGMILTDLGRELALQAFLGGVLTFTKAAIGQGSLAVGDDPRTFVALKSHFADITIHSSAKVGDATFRVRSSFTNTEFVTDMMYREIGIYAKIDDGSEMLYAYRNAGTQAEPIAAYDGTNRIERVIDIINYIGDADNVTCEINESVTYALVKDFQECETKVEGINGTEIVGYLQDFQEVYGGKGYLDRITGLQFLPANLADGQSRIGTWTSANGDWEPLDLKKVSDKLESLPKGRIRCVDYSTSTTECFIPIDEINKELFNSELQADALEEFILSVGPHTSQAAGKILLGYRVYNFPTECYKNGTSLGVNSINFTVFNNQNGLSITFSSNNYLRGASLKI